MHGGETVVIERRERGRLGRAIIAGFVALAVSTVSLVVVSGVVGAIGEAFRDRGLVFEWMYQLTHNPVVEFGRGELFASLAVHLFFGMVWALLYAAAFEPRLRHYPGWLSGALFSMLPFFLSVVLFLPVTGGGFFGSNLQAGPLPLIGNLILHLIYGATLGGGYAADRYEPSDDFEDSPVEVRAQRATMGRAETDAARGILVGALFGGVLGALSGAVLPFSSGEALVGNWSVALGVGGALAGGAVGALIGSMAGLSVPEAEVIEAPKPTGQPVSAAILPLCAIVVVATLIVSIGSLLLTVAGDVHKIHSVEEGTFLNPYYVPAILTGLGILTVIVGGAAVLHIRLPRPRAHPDIHEHH